MCLSFLRKYKKEVGEVISCGVFAFEGIWAKGAFIERDRSDLILLPEYWLQLNGSKINPKYKRKNFTKYNSFLHKRAILKIISQTFDAGIFLHPSLLNLEPLYRSLKGENKRLLLAKLAGYIIAYHWCGFSSREEAGDRLMVLQDACIHASL